MRGEQIQLSAIPSTNTYASERSSDLPDRAFIQADYQTGGRGQRGNAWESHKGENLLCTYFWRPEGFPARNQFAMSEAVALAVADLLERHSIKATVKWPNDIYAGDKKICGILIEHSLMGQEVTHSIIGVGLNVNQTEFVSDAPNPVSMRQLSGQKLNLVRVAEEFAEILEERLDSVLTPEGRRKVHGEFKEKSYRMDGKGHRFFDVAEQREYTGVIEEIEEMGFLHVRDMEKGTEKKYAFKEIIYQV